MRIPDRKNIFIGSQLENRRIFTPITAGVGRASRAVKDRKQKRDTKSFQGSTYFHSKHLRFAELTLRASFGRLQTGNGNQHGGGAYLLLRRGTFPLDLRACGAEGGLTMQIGSAVGLLQRDLMCRQGTIVYNLSLRNLFLTSISGNRPSTSAQ